MEIEARAKVKNLDELKIKLVDLGAIFSTKETQSDWLFKHPKEGTISKPGSQMFRIRNTGDKLILTYKELTNVVGSWIEYETLITNAEDVVKMLNSIGFEKKCELNKIRIHGKLDGINFCLDDIKELGTFIEFEIVSDKPEEAKIIISNIFSKLGYSKEDIIHFGYGALLFQKLGYTFEGTG